MEPITLITAAFIAGLTAGVTDVAKAAIKDTYETFVTQLKQKIQGHEDAQMALKSVENSPESRPRQEVLKEALGQLGVGNDDELVKLAQTIIEKIDEKDPESSKYVTNITGSQGIIIGDHAKVDQKFDIHSRKE